MPNVKEIPVGFVVERAKAQTCADAAKPYRNLIADWFKENHYELEGYETLREIDDHFPSLKPKAIEVSMREHIVMPGCVLGRFRTNAESADLLVKIIHEIHRRMTIPLEESRRAQRPEDVRQTTWTWPHVMRVMVNSGIIDENTTKAVFGSLIEHILGNKVKPNSIRRVTHGDYNIVRKYTFDIKQADRAICDEILRLFMPLLSPNN